VSCARRCASRLPRERLFKRGGLDVDAAGAKKNKISKKVYVERHS
jgi:hypothetical protein